MLSKHNNFATFWLDPGFREFEVYDTNSSFHEATDSHPFIADQVQIIEEDEISYCNHDNPWKSEPHHAHPRKVDMDLTIYISIFSKHWNIPLLEPTIDEEGISDEALLLRYHRKFGHISFSRLQDMAKTGVIPKRLRKCRIPMCLAYMYSKATKRPWKGKKLTYEPKVITESREVI